NHCCTALIAEKMDHHQEWFNVESRVEMRRPSVRASRRISTAAGVRPVDAHPSHYLSRPLRWKTGRRCASLASMELTFAARPAMSRVSRSMTPLLLAGTISAGVALLPIAPFDVHPAWPKSDGGGGGKGGGDGGGHGNGAGAASGVSSGVSASASLDPANP